MPQHQKLNQNKQKYKHKNNKTSKKVVLNKNKIKFSKKKSRNSRDLLKSSNSEMKQRIERELREKASRHGVSIRSFKLGDPAVREK